MKRGKEVYLLIKVQRDRTVIIAQERRLGTKRCQQQYDSIRR